MEENQEGEKMGWMQFIGGLAKTAVDYRVQTTEAKRLEAERAAMVSDNNPLSGQPMPQWVLPAAAVAALAVVAFVALR